MNIFIDKDKIHIKKVIILLYCIPFGMLYGAVVVESGDGKNGPALRAL